MFRILFIGYGNDRRTYPVMVGEEKWKDSLKIRFPKETKAIDEFFELMKHVNITYLLIITERNKTWLNLCVISKMDNFVITNN